MAKRLKVIEGVGPDVGRVFELPEQGELHLGRGPQTVSRFQDVSVSGSHCTVYATRGGSVTITDNGSRNGTYVDGKKLVPDQLIDLAPGSRIRLGDNTVLEVQTDQDIALMKTIQGKKADLDEALREYERERQQPPVRVERPPAPPVRPAPPPEPTISVQCACGQQLLAREKYAGSQVRCPNCRRTLNLPGRAALAQPVTRFERFEDVEEQEPAPEKSRLSLTTVILIIAAAVLVLAGVVVAAGMYFKKAPAAPPQKEAVYQPAPAVPPPAVPPPVIPVRGTTGDRDV
jgi:predicted component of type VI protein secretion system